MLGTTNAEQGVWIGTEVLGKNSGFLELHTTVAFRISGWAMCAVSGFEPLGCMQATSLNSCAFSPVKWLILNRTARKKNVVFSGLTSGGV